MYIAIKIVEIVVVKQGCYGDNQAKQPYKDHGYDSYFEGHASKAESENDANQAVNCDDGQGEDGHFTGYSGNYASKDAQFTGSP